MCPTEIHSYLGAFAKLRKTTTSVVISVCLIVSLSVSLSLCPSTWNISAPTWRIFMKFYMRLFLKYLDKIQVSLKYNDNSNLREDQFYLWPHISQLFLEWEIFQRNVVEKFKTPINIR